MLTRLEREGTSVVLVGIFEPAKFTPAWFVESGLLPKTVAEEAVLHMQPGVCEFQLNWLHFHADVQRIQVEVSQAPYNRVRELVVNMFKNYPLPAQFYVLGINRQVHFLAKNPASRNVIWRFLAPSDTWNERVKDSDIGSGIFEMTSLKMRQSQIEGRPLGDRVNVIIEPSQRLEDKERGIYIQVNDHYENNNQNPQSDMEDLIKKLDEEFDASMKRSANIIDYIASLQDAGEPS